MASSAVGSRELKTRLGTYVRRVREGRSFVATDRGAPIAELRPIPHHAVQEHARFHHLAVVFHHRGQQLLVRQDARSTRATVF
jgi:antitoxin (DNA-binding transcriptional repressor) of toxin-antitoxin stability system